MVFSQQASKVKKFIFSPLTLKVGASVLVLLLGLSGYLLYDYLTYQKKVFDLKELRSELQSRQAEIQSFLEKITHLEEQLSRLKFIEEQVKKDLTEVQELKREKKIKKGSLPPVPPPKAPESPEAIEPEKKSAYMKGEQVSILEKERPRLVSRIHIELFELSKEAFQREQNLRRLQGFLQVQKSVLMAIPSLWPVFGRITSAFGETRFSASSGGTRPHMGIDISAPPGTPIVAPADGVVISAGREAEYGLLVSIHHGHGFSTMFGHLQEILVKAGDKVRAGEVIGKVGSSGKTTGPHLHYEVRIHGRPVNPYSYLTCTSQISLPLASKMW